MPELAHVLSEYGPSLGRVIAAYVARPADREDLAQDIALALLRALPGYRGESSLRTYVLRIAHICAVRFITRKRLKGVHVREDAEVADPAPGPEQSAAARQDAAVLAAQLRQLPLAMCQVLSLTLEGLSQREIGEVLGIAENVVSVRLHRARKLLRQRLEREVKHG